MIPARVAERAFTKWMPDENGCHISDYSTGSHGYAQVGWWENGKSHMVTAHRAAWTHIHGEPPPDHDIDHRPTCSKKCVNLEHLRELTASENRRRSRGRWDAPLGYCIYGHPDSERTIKSDHGTHCRLCKEVGR